MLSYSGNNLLQRSQLSVNNLKLQLQNASSFRDRLGVMVVTFDLSSPGKTVKEYHVQSKEAPKEGRL